ncbi:glycoside hydrolase family 18 protein [Paenibacillus sp. IHBB 10380]|uniref:glycoside hydrolase family 18 protein n=1 Tax=Paenibacillus sp. IHBB 10380 TaxID=1566358 RepID=UPI0005CFCAF3|nr:glycosyl hydrolase family 18 protein [Paenibacillus sp. IHBB 10380]AJS61736.1 chitinase [Paenibacillus sp. IHBB 10380]
MKISLYTKAFLAILVIGMGIYFYDVNYSDPKKITSVYIPIWKDFKDINLKDKNIDIAIIAFAKIDKTNVYFDLDPAKNEEIKENIKKLQMNNKKTSFILGVGGYKADGFSDASLDGNRYHFTESMIAMVKELDLDGIDIDWEYPAFDSWNTTKARPEDTKNFTNLMKELKEKLDRLPRKNKNYYLTFAAGNEDWFFKNVEINKVEKYVDFINVMSYDLTGAWSDTTGYNSNLFKDKNGKSITSVDRIINLYLKRNVDPKKLLLGIPAYSYAWENVKSATNKDAAFSMGKPIDINKVDLSYKTIKEKYLNKDGFKRYYDDTAKTAYLYDGDTFITYEDPEALKAKVKYIKDKNLAGAMVWEYSQDSDDGIVKYLADNLNK